MAEDSSLLPTVDPAPGQAPYYTSESSTTIPSTGGTVTGKGIAFDYSNHLDRLVTALDQISISLAIVAEHTQNISDNLENRLLPNFEIVTSRISSMDEQMQTLATKISSIESYQKTMKELGEGEGIHFVGPYEWLSMYSIYRLLVEQGTTDFESFKAQIDSLPKNF